jgi:hypothetical protein
VSSLSDNQYQINDSALTNLQSDHLSLPCGIEAFERGLLPLDEMHRLSTTYFHQELESMHPIKCGVHSTLLRLGSWTSYPDDPLSKLEMWGLLLIAYHKCWIGIIHGFGERMVRVAQVRSASVPVLLSSCLQSDVYRI